MSLKHSSYLSRTFEIARSAASKGNHPFGALLVLDSQIAIEAENSVVETKDQTRHAELCLVSEACRIYPPEVLARATLYSSTEPCAMCSGAIFWSGIRHIVFGCSALRLGQVAGGSFTSNCRDILSTALDPVCIEGPYLEEEAVNVHLDYGWRT